MCKQNILRKEKRIERRVESELKYVIKPNEDNSNNVLTFNNNI